MGSSLKSRSNQIERGLGHIELQFERGDTVGRVTGIGRSPGGANVGGAMAHMGGATRGLPLTVGLRPSTSQLYF